MRVAARPPTLLPGPECKKPTKLCSAKSLQKSIFILILILYNYTVYEYCVEASDSLQGGRVYCYRLSKS